MSVNRAIFNNGDKVRYIETDEIGIVKSARGFNHLYVVFGSEEIIENYENYTPQLVNVNSVVKVGVRVFGL